MWVISSLSTFCFLFLLSYSNWNTLTLCLLRIIFFCWIITALCWVLTGVDFFVHTWVRLSFFPSFLHYLLNPEEPPIRSKSSMYACSFGDDTCLALEDFKKNPQNSSLSSILPCGGSTNASKALVDISSIVYKFIDEVQQQLASPHGYTGRGLDHDYVSVSCSWIRKWWSYTCCFEYLICKVYWDFQRSVTLSPVHLTTPTYQTSAPRMHCPSAYYQM